MNRKVMHALCAALGVSLFVCLAGLAAQAAGSSQPMKGWELGSPYNKLYNAKELDKLRGTITKFIEVSPMPGMAAGTAFYLDEGDNQPILVQLCPVAYATARQTGLRTGIKTKVRGSWTVINDQDVFMAAKVKQGEHFDFKVRLTKDGTPFWTMSPAERKKQM